MTTWIFLAVLVPSIISLWGTEAVRRYALRTSMVDVPNHRSSHTVPTPRGGGIAIVAGIVAMLGVLVGVLPEQRPTAIGLLGGGLLVGAIGFLDDRYELSAKLRLLVQTVAAIWLLGWLGGVGSVSVGGFDATWLALPAAVVFIVWSTNVYNFMDGLDGFAGGQAVVAATAAAFLCLQANDSLLAFTMLATSGAAAGFLIWNWPPAKIFMGDCGSGFLGFLFAGVAVAAYRHGTLGISTSVMLLMVFLVDATLTLLRRMLQGEAWHQAHRSHAYQLATQLGANHKQVTLISLGLFTAAAVIAIFMESQNPASAFLAIGFAATIVAVWVGINCLFVGRTQTLNSISSQRFNKLPRQHMPASASSAKILYLRFRRFQSQLRIRRSNMPQSDLLAEATGIASRLGYTVSHDWLDGCGGGNVEAAGEKWILLDFNMTKRDQVRQILLTIHDEAETLETMSADLKSALQQAASETKASAGITHRAA